MNDSEVTEYLDNKESERKNKRLFRAGVIAILIAFLLAFIGYVAQSYYRGEALSRVGTALNEQRDQLLRCSDVPKNERAKAGCETPVAPKAQDIIDNAEGPIQPIEKIGPTGEQGQPGPGPSTAQVRAAINVYCSSGVCNGDRPTAAQVSNAVAAYCDERGDCAGMNGSDGNDGPGPSAAQIASAVSEFCAARDNCQGPQGATGDTGSRGEQGAQGPSGVVATTVDPSCDSQDGQYISSVRLVYDADTSTLSVVCSKQTDSTLPNVN